MQRLDVRSRERADAARNRERILRAARLLVAERGLERVSMDDVAQTAGVGKGTVYRRFGDRAGLALALLDDAERELQERVVRGPPPLGPGAPAGERLVAFVASYVRLLERHTELVVASDTAVPGARYRSGVYSAWRAHVALLLREARPDLDAEVAADLVLAPLAGDLYRHLRHERGLGARRVQAAVEALTRSLL
jgi:AcrR family transcriptional regulator